MLTFLFYFDKVLVINSIDLLLGLQINCCIDFPILVNCYFIKVSIAGWYGVISLNLFYLLTLIREIPNAVFLILPASWLQTFGTNWWGSTHTRRSASLAASATSGTATWWRERKEWDAGSGFGVKKLIEEGGGKLCTKLGDGNGDDRESQLKHKRTNHVHIFTKLILLSLNDLNTLLKLDGRRSHRAKLCPLHNNFIHNWNLWNPQLVWITLAK